MRTGASLRRTLPAALLVTALGAVLSSCTDSTVAPPWYATVVATGDATVGEPDSATVRGTVDPQDQETTAWFEYGTAADLAAHSRTPGIAVEAGIGQREISATLAGLAPDTEYFYRIAARNVSGTTRGDVRSFTTPPPPPARPSGLVAEAVSHRRIELAWGDESQGEARFELERREGSAGSWETVATPDPNTTTHADTGVEPGTSYAYRVSACDVRACSEPSEVAEATTPEAPSAPAAPSDLAATAASESRVDLTWTDNSDDETRFELERRAGQGDWTVIATPEADATSHADTGVEGGVSYTYRVRACNDLGCSDPSGEAAATTPAPVGPPAPPSGLRAEAVSANRIDLTWKDESDDEEEFRIERRKGADPWREAGTTAADDTAFSDRGLEPSTTYSYRVRACNAAGCSGPSSGVSARTLVGDPPPPDGADTVKIVTFGDSNFNAGFSGSEVVVSSYVSQDPQTRLDPDDPNSSRQVAGKIESAWNTATGDPIVVVNHSIGGTGTGSGRTSKTAPNARESVDGSTRFEGEVIGKQYPWNGGETGSDFPPGGIDRVNAYTPTANDFVLVSLGTNDLFGTMSASQIASNLEWMADRWMQQGLPAENFIVTTLPPATPDDGRCCPGQKTADTNVAIREMAARTGVSLVDLAAHTSDDDGVTWRSASLHVGDGIHYSDGVKSWIAGETVDLMTQALAAVVALP